MPKRRKFKESLLQRTYDELRSVRLDPEQVRGMGGDGNAYAVGYTRPHEQNRLFPKGSKSYAAWAAGVDNAHDDANSSS
jgi:hypothetical protein